MNLFCMFMRLKKKNKLLFISRWLVNKITPNTMDF